MNLNFEYFKVFYYVCKYGSLTRAARVLMTSQPTVTRTIHNLENELGCRLFIRSKNGMELTPEGQIFYKHISAACAQIFKGVSELTGMSSLDNGTVCISATETALHCFLFKAMEEFHRQYPNVRFKLLNNSTVTSIQSLKSGSTDMAVVSSDPLQTDKHLKTKVLRKYQDILIGGNKFRELAGKSLTLNELMNYPWVTLTRNFLYPYQKVMDMI